MSIFFSLILLSLLTYNSTGVSKTSYYQPTIYEKFRSNLCSLSGGELQGMGGRYCDKITSDYGKKCTNSSQCIGRCMTKTYLEVGTKTIGECCKFAGNVYGQGVENGVAEEETGLLGN